MSVLTILYRNIKWRFHNLFTIVVTVLQPILWLVLYSTVASQTMKNMGIKNYTAFILPGIVVLVSFSACSSSGIMNYMMKTDGSFYRILIAPVNRSFIVLGQILEAVLCTFIEVGIMLIISWFFSVKIFSGIVSFSCIIILIFLTAFFMAGLSYSISLILPNEMLYETVMNAIVLPIFFLSSALFPVENIIGVLKVIINLNPFTHVINTLRSLMLYGTVDIKNMIIVLTLFTIIGFLSFAWALYNLNNEMNL